MYSNENPSAHGASSRPRGDVLGIKVRSFSSARRTHMGTRTAADNNYDIVLRRPARQHSRSGLSVLLSDDMDDGVLE